MSNKLRLREEQKSFGDCLIESFIKVSRTLCTTCPLFEHSRIPSLTVIYRHNYRKKKPSKKKYIYYRHFFLIAKIFYLSRIFRILPLVASLCTCA
ncbi:hypothetical protein PUN28_012477 [Cardiocondyla obscurior]|uniref:Uncharacterized protein n=1 Tax=Cardiocondyla obscurior TaxID=286306 RepID=A0AAW2FBU0_9HYME